MKSIQEQIEVMQHFANCGVIERYNINIDNWEEFYPYSFNWSDYDYRIKKQNKTITIEKWLCKDGDNSYFVRECSHIDGYEKVKLLETYEVEL